MLVGLDHLVILVESLEEAVADYESLGFRVTPGGYHVDGLIRNAIVPFADGTYLKLAAFVDPDDERDDVWGWRSFLESGGGLIDYCVASDDLEADVRRLEKRGLAVSEPSEGGLRLPNGEEVRWKMARIHQEGRVLPFILEDLTPRGVRVPGGTATGHPNGAAGISRLLVAARNTTDAWRSFVALTGEQVAQEPENTFHLGRHDIAFEGLEALDPGLFAVELETAGSTAESDGSLTVF